MLNEDQTKCLSTAKAEEYRGNPNYVFTDNSVVYDKDDNVVAYECSQDGVNQWWVQNRSVDHKYASLGTYLGKDGMEGHRCVPRGDEESRRNAFQSTSPETTESSGAGWTSTRINR